MDYVTEKYKRANIKSLQTRKNANQALVQTVFSINRMNGRMLAGNKMVDSKTS